MDLAVVELNRREEVAGVKKLKRKQDLSWKGLVKRDPASHSQHGACPDHRNHQNVLE